MANYNPHSPTILGQEWEPIAYEPYTMETSVERGVRFALTAQTVPLLGLYSLDAEPTGQVLMQCPMVNLYRAGEEDSTGPVLETLVAVSAATTGSAGDIQIVGGATSITDALARPSDGGFVVFGSSSSASTLDLAFDLGSVSSLLAGKRIVNVSLLYTATGDWSTVGTGTGMPSFSTSLYKGGVPVLYGTGVLAPGGGFFGEYITSIEELSFGEINPFGLGAPSSTSQRVPWRNSELQWFTAGSGTPLRVRLAWADATGQGLAYAALRIRYCEETRLMYGGTHIGYANGPSSGTARYTAPGSNTVVLRTASGHATGAGIPAGPYTVTSHLADLGEQSSFVLFTYVVASDLTRPTARALRQSYEIPGLSGIEITRPRTPGLPASGSRVEVLPYVSFAPTGGTSAHGDTHAYGTQYAAPVYQGMTAAQSVGFLSGTIPTTAYRYVRFMARRFGDASAPLTVTVAGPSSTSASASITAAEFDALEPAAGGWREVTLRLSSALSRDATVQPVTWSSPSAPGDRWEILAADGDGTNGTSNYQSLFVPLTALGASVFTADAVVMLSTESAAPTGAAASAQTLALRSVPLVCAEPAACIPTGLSYNQISWGLPPGTAAGYDTFTRTGSGGWGTSDTGQAWSVGQGSSGPLSTNGHAGVITPVNSPAVVLYAPTGVADYTVTTLVSWSIAASGDSLDGGIVGRWASSSNHYRYRVRATTSGTWTAAITRVVSGTETALTTDVMIPGVGSGPGATVRLRAEAEGSVLRLRVWPDGQPEPAEWTLTVSDTSHTSGQVGAWAQRVLGNLGDSPAASFDDFTLTPVASTHGWTEVQRLDFLDQVWETIAKITSPGVSSMRDYEARPGVLTYYRIRRVNALGFEGEWAVVGVVPPAPGVTGAGDAPGVLMFTSNADQDGDQVFAYMETGAEAPDFAPEFAEAGQVTYTYQAGRDYPTARHRRERGGMSWTVNVLTDRAAVSAAQLERSWSGLRGLAWDALPYVCVRTGDADRWYASIAIPGGSVRRRVNAATGQAQIRITQIQGEPEPVDIAWGP